MLRQLDTMTPLPTHRSLALGIFRQSVFFIFAIAAFAERDEHTRTMLTVSVFLLDVVSWHLSEVVALYTLSVYNCVWHDTLTNRFLLEYLADLIKAKQHIDVPALVKESTAAANQNLMEHVNRGLENPVPFAEAYGSLQSARNCLEHRDGIVGWRDVDAAGVLKISMPRAKVFVEQGGVEVEVYKNFFAEKRHNNPNADGAARFDFSSGRFAENFCEGFR
ncbi:hypothetical protein [Bradyrhizobium sp. BR 10261]|uniref:hypothetical protein n=1 Tax=Bradyrhizobium sp. BR 10261 TaxID=2749992 RepID=UPI001C64FD24|nr:hypothetical protein [Bradyrhizobium sp. BR 10261]MBW7965543.1 hypothetical protein [Bradyrhizobium sp. BR 10261]